MSEFITTEGTEELERQVKRFRDAISAHATLLAQKDGMGTIDAIHIRKASKRVTIGQGSTMKWVLLISTVVLAGFAFFQLSIVNAVSQMYLWFLPLFSILWVGIVSYIFKDFL